MATQAANPRFVGRMRQLAQLEEALDQALGGLPSVVLVRGEAGVGKSRLILEFLASARARTAMTLSGGCIDVSAGDLPFVPLRAAFRRLIEENGAEQTARLLGPAAGDLHVLLPEVGRPPPDDDQAGPSPHVFEVVAAVVAALARESCVVLAVDDAQWADVSTLQLLRYLTHQRSTLRLLLVVAYRGEDLPREPPWLKAFEELSRSAVGVVAVEPFSSDEAAELLAIVGTDLGDDAVARIVSRSDGLPFLVEELVAAEQDNLTGGIPTRFREVLRLRFGALSRPARTVVELVAVSGRPGEHRVLATASGLSRREFAAGLGDALQAGLLLEHADRNTFGFRHDLIREVVYADLAAPARCDLHARLAAALEAQLPPVPYATQLGEVAHHWLQSAGNDEAAIRATLRAARASTDAFAHPEAARRYDQVLGLWNRVDEPEKVCGTDIVSLLTEAAEAARWAGAPDHALRLVDRALDAAEPGDRTHVAALYERRRLYTWLDTGYLAAGPEREEVQATSTRERIRASDLMQSGRYFESIGVARQALQLAVAAQSTSDEIRASYILGVGLAMSGSTDEGIRTIRGKLGDAIDHGTTEEVIAGHVNLAFILLNDGQMDESASVALAGLDEAVKRGAAAADGALLAANAASSLQRLGRLVEADRVLTEALDRHPPRTHAAILRLTLAEVDVMRGRLAQAEQGLRAVVAAKLPKDYQFNAQLRTVEAELQLWTARVGPTIQLADVRRGGLGSQLADVGGDDDVLCAARLCWLGVRADADAASLARGEAATGRVRQLEEDGQLLADSVQVLAAHPLGDGTRRQLDASIALVAAELTRLLDQPSPDLWQRSAQAWETDDAYLHGYSLWRLGLTLRAARRPREAERALRDGYDLAARTGMQALVAAIDAAGKALGVRMDQAQPAKDAPGAPRPYNLTPKEMEVLEQLVAGRTNRKIATALFMSEKTASVHVSHILAKLAVTSRGEAIVRAYELGLTPPGRVHQG